MEYDCKVLYLKNTVELWWFGQITLQFFTVTLMSDGHRLENYISLIKGLTPNPLTYNNVITQSSFVFLFWNHEYYEK